MNSQRTPKLGITSNREEEKIDDRKNETDDQRRLGHADASWFRE